MGELETWTHTVDPRRHIDPAAEVGRGRNFLFTVLPGEILYIGHFEFLKWDFSDRLRSLNYFQDEAAARQVLVDYPGISGPRSEEHTSELQSLMRISYAVF